MLTTLQNYLDLMPGHVYLKDKNGVMINCNDNLIKYFEFKSKNELIGTTDFDVMDHKQATLVRKTDVEIMESATPQSIEEIAKLPTRDATVFLSRKEPLFDASKNVIGIIGISIDITNRKKEAMELKQLNEKFEKANAMQIKLLQNMHHNLKTPSNNLSWLLNHLKFLTTSEEKKEAFYYMTQYVHTLLKQLNKLLNFTNI